MLRKNRCLSWVRGDLWKWWVSNFNFHNFMRFSNFEILRFAKYCTSQFQRFYIFRRYQIFIKLSSFWPFSRFFTFRRLRLSKYFWPSHQVEFYIAAMKIGYHCTWVSSWNTFQKIAYWKDIAWPLAFLRNSHPLWVYFIQC